MEGQKFWVDGKEFCRTQIESLSETLCYMPTEKTKEQIHVRGMLNILRRALDGDGFCRSVIEQGWQDMRFGRQSLNLKW
jgi:hypothetical protein